MADIILTKEEHFRGIANLNKYSGICDNCASDVSLAQNESVTIAVYHSERANVDILLPLDYKLNCPYCGIEIKHIKIYKNLEVTEEYKALSEHHEDK